MADSPAPSNAPHPPRGPTTGPPLLQLRGISKSFFGVEVLSDVDLECREGEVHAILGENGAGKSTLMKIIAGAHQPTRGEMLLDGETVHFSHPQDAQQRGVSIIYQEFNLLPERTVAQNIFLGREPKRGPFVDQRKMERATEALLEDLGVRRAIDPRKLIREHSVAQQQMVEIAKALSFDSRLLIMDEPTAPLSPPEVESLFEVVRRLQDRGLSVLYISHRLKEVFELADWVTVLKDGEKVGTVRTEDVTSTELVKMMVGRTMDHYFPPRAKPEEIGQVRLRVTGGATDKLRDINFEVRSGEILGIAGLEGSGRTEIARALFGADPFTEGTVELDGRPVRFRKPRQAIRRGFGFISEDRKSEGLVLPRSVEENTALALRPQGRRGRQRRKEAGGLAAMVRNVTGRVDLRAASMEQEVQYLSGGNQQKVVLAKWLATKADVLLFDEPTRGIDVGAKAGIHELMRELARNGAAIVMISSELPEVIGMSDRILVMRNGAVSGELPPNPTEAEIMLLATGEHETEGPDLTRLVAAAEQAGEGNDDGETP